MTSMTSTPDPQHPHQPPHQPGPQPGLRPGPQDGAACDGHSVGVIVRDGQGRVLIGDRTDGAGAAPPAGHVFDVHTGYRDAAHAEVAEETGLTLRCLTEITQGWRPNRCRRGDGPHGPGHHWIVYRATCADTTLSIDPGSFRSARWADRAQLRALVTRTIAYTSGDLTSAQWAAQPGIEPVWVRWLHAAGLIALPTGVWDGIEYVVAHGPRVWTHDPAPGGVVCGVSDPAGPDGICGRPLESSACDLHRHPHDPPNTAPRTALQADPSVSEPTS